MALSTIYKHWNTAPVRGREIDVNFDALISQMNRSSQFAGTASATVANTGTETSIIGTGSGTLTIPANTLVIGRSIGFTLAGVYSTTSPAGTLQFRVRLGGISGTVVLDSGAQTPSDSMANRGFEISGLIQCRTIGATGTVLSQGKAILSTAAGTAVIWDMETTAAVTIDTTVSQQFQVSADWQTAAAGNTITGSVFLLQILG